ncbi:MAG TPA: glutamate synthase subunit alpha, partial [Clostridia bacterium]|nr:glutamate synthase subunit alpha [Clostridia bacterium]
THPNTLHLEDHLDKVLISEANPAIKSAQKVWIEKNINNINRTVGAMLSGEISKRYGEDGLPADTINCIFHGSAGQSFGAFLTKGVSFRLQGDANDYLGKGLSGGKIIIRCPEEADYVPEENIIIGNVAFYGATGGEAYVNGVAGERFCVRNSGVHAVVEGVGDHGCEYMTGGRVVVLGKVGRNFAAGMSGGIAYVYDSDGTFEKFVNKEMVLLERLNKNIEADMVRSMIKKHYQYTDSDLAERLLDKWNETLEKFVKVIPVDYKNIITEIESAVESGRDLETAQLAAFRKYAG